MDSRRVSEITVDELCKIIEDHYELLLSYEQASIILKCTKAHLCQLVHQGKIRSAKGFGTNCKFIKKSEIENYIERISVNFRPLK